MAPPDTSVAAGFAIGCTRAGASRRGSHGQIFAITGHKDITGAARLAGRMTGQAAGYLAAARAKFSSFTQTAELAQVLAFTKRRNRCIVFVRHIGCLNENFHHHAWLLDMAGKQANKPSARPQHDCAGTHRIHAGRHINTWITCLDSCTGRCEGRCRSWSPSSRSCNTEAACPSPLHPGKPC